MQLRTTAGVIVLLTIASVVFSKCIELNRFYEKRTTCNNYSCCGYTEGQNSICIKNCSGACDKTNSNWDECLDECEPGTCSDWSSISHSGVESCDLEVCIEWDPKTTLCVERECAWKVVTDEVYHKCSNPVCGKNATLEANPHVGSRQFPE